MSRSNYSYDGDAWEVIRWRGAVQSAIRGQRGQEFLVELLAALDAMPNKRLVSDDFVQPCGEVCTLGAIGRARGYEDLDKLDPKDHARLSERFGIAKALVQEIEYMNDEGIWCYFGEIPEKRWKRMRAWVQSKIEVEA